MANRVIPTRNDPRRNPRLADGSKHKDTLRMNVTVDICPMCKKVVKQLYDHKHGQLRTKICAECKGKF